MTKKNPVAKAAAKRTAVKAKTPLLTKIEKFQHDPKLLKTGMRAKFTRMDSNQKLITAEGRILVEKKNTIYFVSNNSKFNGAVVENKLGFKYSWEVRENLGQGWFVEILPVEKGYTPPPPPLDTTIYGRQVEISAERIKVGCVVVPRKQIEEIYNEMNRLKGIKTNKKA